MIIKEENFKWHLEAFASELFKYVFKFSIITPVFIICWFASQEIFIIIFNVETFFAEYFRNFKRI